MFYNLSEVSIIEPGQPKDQHNQACFNLGRPVSFKLFVPWISFSKRIKISFDKTKD